MVSLFFKVCQVQVSGGNYWFNSDVVDGLFLPGLLVNLVCWGLPRGGVIGMFAGGLPCTGAVGKEVVPDTFS